MPRYEQAFRDVCSLAGSSRVSDRKKCIVKLTELYDSAEAIEELDTNSKTQNGTATTWTAIMYSVHKVLLHEAERSTRVDDKLSGSTSKSSRARENRESVHRNNSITMLDTVKKANSSEIFLKCGDLVGLILQIFSDHKYMDYQKIYLTILVNHLLPVKQYQTNMSSDHWKELLDSCIGLYKNPYPNIDKILILRAICGIVQHGCTQSHLALRLKGILQFLVQVINDAKSDPRNLSDDTFVLVNAVCQRIGPESRMALCEFGEIVMRSAIDLNDNCAKYDWMLLVVRAHHPGSVTQNHNAAYACNWDTWNNILRAIYCMVINNLSLEFVSISFIQLACEVSRQLKDDSTSIDNDIAINESSFLLQPPKRRRTVIGIQGMIDVLITTPLNESKYSVQILNTLITEYSECVKENNFLPLLEFLNASLNTCTDTDVMYQLWQLGRVMVEFEKKLSTDLIKNTEIQAIWLKIWNTTLRSVSKKENDDQVHKLLQSLLVNKKVIDGNDLLNLYLKDTVTWSKFSIHSLLVFCQHNISQISAEPPVHENNLMLHNDVPLKVRLLRWVLAIPQSKWNVEFPIEDVCELLTAVVAKVFSNFCQLNIAQESMKVSFGTIIKNSLQEISLSIEEMIKSKRKLRGKSLIHVLEALYVLYNTPYHIAIIDIIRSSTESNMLKNILSLTDVERLRKISDESEMDNCNTSIGYIQNMNDLSERHRLMRKSDEFQKTDSLSEANTIRMKACTVCASFCCMVNSDGMTRRQENLQITLLQSDNYDLTEIYDFKMALQVLESLMSGQSVSLSGNVIQSLLKLLQQLCIIWHKDNEAVISILKILSKLLFRMRSTGSDVQRQNLLRILHKFHQLLQSENNYGPSTYVTFIHCLEIIAKIDTTFDWAKWHTDTDTPVVEDILMYIQSPFHVVRLQAVKCLQLVFASSDVNLEWLKEFFYKLKTVINTLFIVQGELKEKVKEDERTNRVASALHIMGIVISSSAIFRSEALLTTFRLTVDKNINSKITQKMLDSISSTLKMKDSSTLVEKNLNYLLTHWLENGCSLEKFPVHLAHCSSDQEFYQKHMNIVVPTVIQKCSLKEAHNLCNQFGMPFNKVVEDCFPRLIAWLLPCISADPHTPSAGISVLDIQRATGVFNQFYKNENEFQTVQRMSTLIEKNLKSVILDMIERLHDEEHFMEFLTVSIKFSSNDPPHFKHEDITRSFMYLDEHMMGAGHSLLYLLATEKQHVLQAVLLDLKCSIYNVNSIEDKSKALHHYMYFSIMLLQQIDRHYFDQMSAYIIRDICYTLINLTQENLRCITQASCSYLYHLLKYILPKRHTDIESILRSIVTSMIPIVKTNEARHASEILTFLIVEQNHLLGEAIGRLDSFPMDEVFQVLRDIHLKLKYKSKQKQSLENEIRHFLNTRSENTEDYSIAELENLLEQLQTRKIELKEIYQSLGSVQKFSEDCAVSILHQLICALVKLTSSSDPDISLGAAKCLGELGPADLSTMILQPESDHKELVANPMFACTYRILVLLSSFLIHTDVLLLTATSEALYKIMASYWGAQIFVEKSTKVQFGATKESLRIEYIRPFITSLSQAKQIYTIDQRNFIKCIDQDQKLWFSNSYRSHSDWIADITCEILNCFSDSYLKHLIPVCRANVLFCEKILPWIIHLILYIEKKLCTGICDYINRFFDLHFTNTDELKKKSSPRDMHYNICLNQQSVRCMLNVVDYIRSQSADNYQFPLNYLHIAKAAQYCSAYFTSVLYAELWCEKLLKECPVIDYSMPIDYICEIETENGKVLQEILREACIKIGDPDAIYGCGRSYFQNVSAKIEHYVQLRQWNKVLLAYDIEVSLGNKKATKGLLDALQHSGLQYLLGAFVKTVDRSEEDLDGNCRYECAWRLSDWSISTSQQMINLRQENCTSLQASVNNNYPLFHYHALKSFHELDTDGLKTAINCGRVCIINSLRNISLESCKTIYPALSQLQMLREIEEIYFAKLDDYSSMIEKWNTQDSMGVNDFEYIEPILSQRIVLLQSNEKGKNQVVKNALVDTYFRLNQLSKKHGYSQTSARALGSLAKQVELSAEVKTNLQYEEAVLAWMSGDQELGRHLLHNLLVNETLSLSMQAQAFTQYGNWMAETKSENPQRVIDKYYLTSLKYSEKIKNPTERDKKNLLDTQAALAQFADVQYQRILSYMKSPQFESFKECVAYSEMTAETLSTHSKDVDERRAANLNKNQTSNDMAELENIEKEKNMYLLLALKYYILTLQQGEDHNLLVFRLVSLWLDNTHHKESSDLLQAYLNKLQSYKFVLLVPQLAPHMTNSGDAFSNQIYDLLRRCAIEHPHHTLPVLLALMNSHKDHEFQKGKKRQKISPEPRVLTAQKLIENLMSTNINPIIQEMHKLAHSLIMLANLETPRSNSQKLPVPNVSHSVQQIKNFKHTLIPTLSIDIKPNKIYNRIVSIEKYANEFELVGGINAPKKITCLGTDGVTRNQLVKGRDDLRQDAVMQQVFTVMNMLLKTSKEANKRRLNVRTYKVVPLTRRCGVLEWCNNTLPLSVILEGSVGYLGLHKKYYPNDYTTRQCRMKMEAVFKKSNQEKLRVYIDCCKHLHPVFHYFFLESFSSPETWFERRLAYVHSVATTSMIGYILGLGDRHVNNILVDKLTAEVIHIDFGIAFEQGKVLPTPETVPFRLTRDIEAAMGVSGVEGVLRRSCEETIIVLRNHKEIIITLLQVLLYDPLFSWAITPAKAYSLQKGEQEGSSEGQEAAGEINKLAERALLRLEQKLQGTEEGSASSVAGQVERLIQEAHDPTNLSRLYYGWQPYL
ncbi:serine-protein kinase ATM isoform X2 [Diprion similis]|uniref:serine-protein kinase ATM isoform X2 n=1 Tax=Diprion similis TaxID=362088 RepID=UPI001EF959E3|nr:serine-protein kinase ATM isoform X2 [Diprion similis]